MKDQLGWDLTFGPLAVPPQAPFNSTHTNPQFINVCTIIEGVEGCQEVLFTLFQPELGQNRCWRHGRCCDNLKACPCFLAVTANLRLVNRTNDNKDGQPENCAVSSRNTSSVILTCWQSSRFHIIWSDSDASRCLVPMISGVGEDQDTGKYLEPTSNQSYLPAYRVKSWQV